MTLESVISLYSHWVHHWIGQDFWLTRFIFLRALGGIYFVAFLSLFNQFKPLFGHNGLLPAHLFLQQLSHSFPTKFSAFLKHPTLFWIHLSDQAMWLFALMGVILSAAVLLGLSNGAAMLVLWILYMSFVHIGQVFYGYGWESLLLETGFLSIFLYPFWNLQWFPAHHSPPKLIILLLLWVLFRNMFGSGMIKVRGSESWRDFTSLFYHFETQPITNPLSPWFHHLPRWMLKGGVLFNHIVELMIPFFYFLTAPFRIIGGIFTVAFQFILILSGNLSWLNWLTIVLCIPCFDDRVWRLILPQSVLAQVPASMSVTPYTLPTQFTLLIVGGLIAYLSINPIKNLIGPNQAMNTSHDPLHLVNSYGAFGHIGKVRHELVISGRSSPNDMAWKEYEFKAKPSRPHTSHPIISPYHYRLDWQIWFAAMGTYHQNPWIVHLIYKLLINDPETLRLIHVNPFKGQAPYAIKVDLYDYQFPQKGYHGPLKWQRTHLQSYLPELDKNNPSLIKYLHQQGWQ
jgi:hypothetical protein